MRSPQQESVRNRLLSALPVDDFRLVQPHLEAVPLELRQWLVEANQPIMYAIREIFYGARCRCS